MTSPRENSPRVLLVDDDESIRYLITQILGRAGIEVCEAENGAHALEVMESQSIDVILLDLVMPVMDGLHFLAEVRGKRDVKTPILVLTASINAHAGSVDDILEAGASDVVRKPIAAQELISRIERLL